MQVVSAGKDLTVVAVGYESLCNLIDLLRFLRLAAPRSKQNVTLHVETHATHGFSDPGCKFSVFLGLDNPLLHFERIAFEADKA